MEDFSVRDHYKRQWDIYRVLSGCEYLCSLQGNDRPMRIIQNALLSDDGLVRIVRDRTMYTRPVTETVFVLSDAQ